MILLVGLLAYLVFTAVALLWLVVQGIVALCQLLLALVRWAIERVS